MITSTVSSKGQVTIPKQIRDFLKLKKSDKIAFVPLEDGNVLMTRKQVPASALFGMLRHRKKERPVSLEEMEKTVREKRAQRASK